MDDLAGSRAEDEAGVPTADTATGVERLTASPGTTAGVMPKTTLASEDSQPGPGGSKELVPVPAKTPESPAPPLPDGALVELPFDLAEVRTVMAFAIRRLVGLNPSDIQVLNEAVARYEAAGRKGPQALAASQTIIDKYNKLNDLLAPLGVNGASVCDSAGFRWWKSPLVAWGVVFLVVGVVTEADKMSLAPLLPADGSAGSWLRSLPWDELLRYLGPAMWGGLGACVFLLKTISDRVSDFTYEDKRLSGIGARVFLGMVFGALVVNAFMDTSAGFASGLPTAGAAFLAGLGVKAVYAAVEGIVNGIAGGLSGRIRNNDAGGVTGYVGQAPAGQVVVAAAPGPATPAK